MRACTRTRTHTCTRTQNADKGFRKAQRRRKTHPMCDLVDQTNFLLVRRANAVRSCWFLALCVRVRVCRLPHLSERRWTTEHGLKSALEDRPTCHPLYPGRDYTLLIEQQWISVGLRDRLELTSAAWTPRPAILPNVLPPPSLGSTSFFTRIPTSEAADYNKTSSRQSEPLLRQVGFARH